MHSQDPLVMRDYPFYLLLDSIWLYVIEDICFYVDTGYWSSFYFTVMFFVWLCIRLMLTAQAAWAGGWQYRVSVLRAPEPSRQLWPGTKGGRWVLAW